MKILLIEIHTIFLWERKKLKNENSQISLSLTNVSPCKNELIIWMISLHIMMVEKLDSMNKSKTKYEKNLMIEKWDSMNKSKN